MLQIVMAGGRLAYDDSNKRQRRRRSGCCGSLLQAARKQLLVVSVMLFSVYAYCCFLEGSREEDGSVQVELSLFLLATGTVLLVLGLAYQQLPVDLIPDWLPFCGQVDDLAMFVLVPVGVALVAAAVVLRWPTGVAWVFRTTVGSAVGAMNRLVNG